VLGRKPVLWDNLHANDYDMRRTFLGPYGGRPLSLRNEVEGILSNPNCEFHLNELPLGSLAAYIQGDSQWNAEADFQERRKEWGKRFDHCFSDADLELLCDCFYLPMKVGPSCQALLTAARESEGGEVLQDVSFRVKPGQTVAIVGQTGSGKTSLVKLINRVHDVSGGAVLVDGVDVREWHLETLRQGISIIEQDIFLFSKSVRENIAFGKPDATEEEIVAAAKAAQADAFIREFADGYDTVIGERGVSLSGGQRQRLALARAFLTDPGVLILDDSTSAVDSATEDHIQQAISAAAAGRTTFIITHRLSQIRWADLILVVRGGRLDAAGTHEQLMAASDAYRRLFQD
ncbi:MAG: ATP-binding cassette domain-containing protein, partial [Victivallales bacterium]|nr:ATP-binding cassette domain-containing protein [Victivallales bacterium]